MDLRHKLRRSLERMPRPAYIFLRSALALCTGMLLCSCLLFALGGGDRQLTHLAELFLKTPAGVLLLTALGLAALLDKS